MPAKKKTKKVAKKKVTAKKKMTKKVTKRSATKKKVSKKADFLQKNLVTVAKYISRGECNVLILLKIWIRYIRFFIFALTSIRV